jgi:hypothetical protein
VHVNLLTENEVRIRVVKEDEMKSFNLAMTMAGVAAGVMLAVPLDLRAAPPPVPPEAAAPAPNADGPGRELARRNLIHAGIGAIDRTTGIITLEPIPGATRPLVLQFAPSAVRDLRLGDRIAARLTYSVGEAPKLKEQVAGDAPRKPEDEPVTLDELAAEMGQMVVTGTVSNLNRTTGELDVTTGKTVPLHLQFAPDAVQNLHEGQTISVDMGFTREGGANDTRG